MNFLEKLNLLMEQKSINKSGLSKISGVPYTTIDGFYKKGYQNVKLPTIWKIADALNVSIDYLIDERVDDPRPPNKNNPPQNEGEVKLVGMYRELNEEGQERLLEYATYLTGDDNFKKVGSFRVAAKEV